MEEIEMVEFAKRYLPIVDPRFVHVAKVDDRIVGFILGLPNFSPGIQKAKGKLFPLGIFHILNSMKRTKQLDLMLGAVEKSYRGRGVEIALAIQLVAECKKAQLDTIEIHLVLESNTLMLAELKRAGCQYHKRFRVFGKEL
jgi:ribosomal protein S18 acetylase RimI-like enzyme